MADRDSLAIRVTDALNELDDRYKNGDINSDDIHEIADSHTPIYNSTILEFALEDMDLATEEPEVGPAFDGSPTAINIIAANIYDRLYGELNRRYDELVSHECAKEFDDEVECGVCGWHKED